MKIRMSLVPSALAVLLLGTATACRTPKVQTPQSEGKTAVQLLQEGEANLKRGRWDEGRRLLRMVEEYFPSSQEFPKAKMLLGDSFFFAGSPSYPEALVEYEGFLNYFPRHEQRELALYRIALCHFASIENAERDQNETQRALQAFQTLIAEAPGSQYVVDARAKITQCWRRLAESELLVGIFYVKGLQFAAAERRLKALQETYPEYMDRERAYFYLGEALRRKGLERETVDAFYKDFLAKHQMDGTEKFTTEQTRLYKQGMKALEEAELAKFRAEARSYYQKLVESYPASEWAGRAKDRLLEMGQTQVKEELDS